MAMALLTTATTVTSADATGRHRVSHGDAYSGCTNPGFAAPGETSFASSEAEPQVAVNPANAGHRIALWIQDVWSGGFGGRGIAGAYTKDGGTSWHTTQMPFSRCAKGGLAVDRAADPWLSFGPDSTVYASAGLIGFFPDPNQATTGVGVATSTDGGATWKHVQPLILERQSSRFYNDKPSITADPRTPGTAYAVWDRTDCPADCGVSVNGTYTQPTLFSRTTDFGATWSDPRVIVPTPSNAFTVGDVIVADRHDGTLYDVFEYGGALPSQGLEEMVKSTDGGLTWSAPVAVGVDDHVGVTDPNTGQAVRTGSALPSVAIEPSHGDAKARLYVAWESSQFSGGAYDEVALATSTDGGGTWATQRVNKPSGGPAFTPSVALDPDGRVGVSYYDFRSLRPGNTTTLPTSAWLTTSDPGGRHFKQERQLSGRSFDMLQAPNSGGAFLGDYQGLAAGDDGFVAAFAAVNDGEKANPTDIFVNVVE